jgi:cholesterol transport system auxiliary component
MSRFAFLLLALFGLSGCLSKQDYPVRNHYILPSSMASHSASKNLKASCQIEVVPVKMNPSFSGQEFVYRTGDNTYFSDYYNLFFSPPSGQLLQSISQNLKIKNTPCLITSNHPLSLNHYTLHASLLSLYGDFRSTSKAVIKINFKLYYLSANGSTLLFDKTYKQKRPIKNNSPDYLINGYQSGLLSIFTSLGNDLFTPLSGAQN